MPGTGLGRSLDTCPSCPLNWSKRFILRDREPHGLSSSLRVREERERGRRGWAAGREEQTSPPAHGNRAGTGVAGGQRPPSPRLGLGEEFRGQAVVSPPSCPPRAPATRRHKRRRRGWAELLRRPVHAAGTSSLSPKTSPKEGLRFKAVMRGPHTPERRFRGHPLLCVFFFFSCYHLRRRQ